MTLYLRSTSLPGEPADDYEVFDANDHRVGHIMLHPQASADTPWFWTIAEGESTAGHGYAASREQAMSALEGALGRRP